jgi:hypothetical protein
VLVEELRERALIENDDVTLARCVIGDGDGKS